MIRLTLLELRGAIWALSVVAAIFALGLAAVLVVTGGTFGYILDDPYIHLSMAEQIVRGEYGINPGEPAAAASSIIYPYLLAALTRLGFGSFGPLFVNAVALAASAVCLAALLDHLHGRLRLDRMSQRIGLLLALCLPLNLVGLAFTGMENGIHVALSLLGLLGILRLHCFSRPPLWWLVVLVVSPLVRYEGFSLVLVGMLILTLNGRPVMALAVLGAALIGPACYAYYLHTLGLPLLPSSVLVKGAEVGVSGSSNPGATLAINFSRNVLTSHGLWAMACLAALLAALVRARAARMPKTDPLFQVALAGSIILGAQLLGGRFPSFGNRYSLYALAFGTVAVAIVYRGSIERFRKGARIGRMTSTVAWIGLSVTIAWQAISIGISAGNIYFQQYQTHRFITEFWRGSIAVNDIGWPSYRNDFYVLDLWGLGSEKARLARSEPDPVGALAALIDDRRIEAVAIYKDWFPSRPASWVMVARMDLTIPLTSAGGSTVTFYATHEAFAAGLKQKLEAFGETIPKGASLRLE